MLGLNKEIYYYYGEKAFWEENGGTYLFGRLITNIVASRDIRGPVWKMYFSDIPVIEVTEDEISEHLFTTIIINPNPNPIICAFIEKYVKLYGLNSIVTQNYTISAICYYCGENYDEESIQARRCSRCGGGKIANPQGYSS